MERGMWFIALFSTYFLPRMPRFLSFYLSARILVKDRGHTDTLNKPKETQGVLFIFDLNPSNYEKSYGLLQATSWVKDILITCQDQQHYHRS